MVGYITHTDYPTFGCKFHRRTKMQVLCGAIKISGKIAYRRRMEQFSHLFHVF